MVGGSSSSSLYSTFLPKVNARLAIDCDFEASIWGQNTSGLNYDITAIVDLKNGTPPSNLKAHLVMTESGFAVSWGICSEANHVCQAMYPTHDGTTVNFAGGNQVIINYTITLDPSWITSNLELVFFLQDDNTKEVLQGTNVELAGLIPLAASADFSCSDTIPCETTTVDFYDNSLGLITSWDWYFEGGTPSTSTAQNPTISYSAVGTYDVQLIVNDGTVIDTLLMEDYIEVISTLPQASTPTGPTDLCSGGTGYEFTTSSVSGASSYTWTIDPASAGTITGTGTTGTLDVDPAYTGNIDVTVSADNKCGSGIVSSPLATTTYSTPAAFWISDGGGYCEGTGGIEVTLSGSETGVDYELLKDGNPTGNIVAGTGSAISFGFQTEEGLYTADAFTDYCENMMYGNSYIYVLEIPGQAAIPAGEDMVCADGENEYITAGATDAETYVWTLLPVEAGNVVGTSDTAVVSWSETYTGAATLTVQGINACGDGVVSDPLNITVNELPEPVISGEEFVTAYTTHNYSSPDHSGAGYSWTVTGGSIDAGQGTSEITVTWGGPGTGYINLTETSAENCEGIAEELIVNIDPVSIEETFMTEFSLYPNPANETLNIELYSQKDTRITIQVVNQLGQVVINSTEELVAGNNKNTINTSDLRNGIYTMKLIATDGTVAQDKFIIMK